MRATAFQPIEKQDAWRNHLQDVIDALGIPAGTITENVSASVALYCRQFHAGGLQQADLKLLLARAFCAVDQRIYAEQVLQSMQPHQRHISRWLEILSELHHFPSLLPYFSLGVIRPADWAGAQIDRMWMIDFGQLVLSESEKHEMMLYRSIRALIEHMFIFWDATSGAGVLGLKGMNTLNLTDRLSDADTTALEGGIQHYIADLFNQQADQRNWTAVPALLNLDL